MADDPRWFLGTFVVKLASPLLLGDAVGALRAAACSAKAGTFEVRAAELELGGAARLGMEPTLRDVVLPGAVERLTKVSKGYGPRPRSVDSPPPPRVRAHGRFADYSGHGTISVRRGPARDQSELLTACCLYAQEKRELLFFVVYQ